MLGGLRTLNADFGSLLKKLLFLGRTLLLRLCVLGTHVRKRPGRLGEQPEQLGASKPVWYRNAGSKASKPVVAQHFVLGGLGPLKEISVAY